MSLKTKCFMACFIFGFFGITAGCLLAMNDTDLIEAWTGNSASNYTLLQLKQYMGNYFAPVSVVAPQRIRVQTDASGNVTWVYGTAFGAGVVPVISVVSETASTTIPQGVQIIGTPTNTQCVFKVINLPATSVLGIVVLGAPTGTQAYIDAYAMAP